MATRFATTGPEGPQLGADDAANLRTQFNALKADVAAGLAAIAEGTYPITAPTLSIGTSSAAEIKNAAFTYIIAGIQYQKASAETAFTATAHDLVDGTVCRYKLSINAGGTITVTKGTAVLVAAIATITTPATPAGECSMGYVQVQTVGAAFDATTTLLSAAEVTDTYVDQDILADVITGAVTSSNLTAN
jgi:hypothetical protein